MRLSPRRREGFGPPIELMLPVVAIAVLIAVVIPPFTEAYAAAGAAGLSGWERVETAFRGSWSWAYLIIPLVILSLPKLFGLFDRMTGGPTSGLVASSSEAGEPTGEEGERVDG